MAWYSRLRSPDDGTWELCLHDGDEHEDGAVVDDRSSHDRTLVTARVSSDGVRSLEVFGDLRLWFVAFAEPTAQPPAMTLVAFDTPDKAAGSVVSAADLVALPVSSDQQVGAVRWFTGTGQVHQVYVAPSRRRQGIGTALLLAAGTFAVASGWPRLWANGERTDLGESLATRGPEVLRRRATARTRTLPPMTPGG